jgi:hypothetical protein
MGQDPLLKRAGELIRWTQELIANCKQAAAQFEALRAEAARRQAQFGRIAAWPRRS